MDRYYVNDDGQIEDGQRPGAYQTLDEVEICTLLNRLTAAESAVATERAAREEAEAERDEARELAVWLARWANSLDFWSEREFAWTSENHTVYSFRHDGTDAGILAALRRAMKGEG